MLAEAPPSMLSDGGSSGLAEVSSDMVGSMSIVRPELWALASWCKV